MAPQAKAFGRLRRVAARRQPARAAPRVSRGAQAAVEANEGKLPGAARRARGGRVRLGPRARPWPEARGTVVRSTRRHRRLSQARPDLLRDEPAQEGLRRPQPARSEEHTSELQSPCNLVCRLLLEKK